MYYIYLGIQNREQALDQVLFMPYRACQTLEEVATWFFHATYNPDDHWDKSLKEQDHLLTLQRKWWQEKALFYLMPGATHVLTGKPESGGVRMRVYHHSTVPDLSDWPTSFTL